MVKAEHVDIKIEEINELEKWNELNSRCSNFNFFSTFEWGDYKSSGWGVYRLAVFKNGNFIGATQILYKTKFGIVFGWSSSGLMLTDWKNFSLVALEVKNFFKCKFCIYYIRFNFFDSLDSEKHFLMDEQKILRRSIYSVNSGYTVRFNLQEIVDIRKGLSSNNRYYLKQAEKKQLNFISLDKVDIEKFVSIHNKMTELKGISDIEITIHEIESLLKKMNQYLKMYLIKDESGEDVASCLVFQNTHSAYYYLAASSDKGRELSASFFMVFKLLEKLKNEGIQNFDFSGITPFKESAKGVNRFKLGFGGNLTRYVGEYDVGSINILRIVFNYAIKILM